MPAVDPGASAGAAELFGFASNSSSATRLLFAAAFAGAASGGAAFCFACAGFAGAVFGGADMAGGVAAGAAVAFFGGAASAGPGCAADAAGAFALDRAFGSAAGSSGTSSICPPASAAAFARVGLATTGVSASARGTRDRGRLAAPGHNLLGRRGRCDLRRLPVADQHVVAVCNGRGRSFGRLRRPLVGRLRLGAFGSFRGRSRGRLGRLAVGLPRRLCRRGRDRVGLSGPGRAIAPALPGWFGIRAVRRQQDGPFNPLAPQP